MIIHLNEHRFSKLFLTESTNSKRARQKTMELIAQRIGKSVEDPMVADDERTIEKVFFGEGLRKDWFIVLEPNVYLWFCEAKDSNLVKTYLEYIYRKATTFTKPSEYIAKIRPIDTFQDLKEFVDPQMAEDDAIEQEKMGNMKTNFNSNYQVLGPLSFEEANKYGNYSNPGGEICYTQSESTWRSSSYSNNNRNCCYLLLRNDWKELEANHDDSERYNGLPEPLNRHNGYDDYGLSMIFLFVDPKGKLHECNTRWNHSADYAPGRSVDKALTEVDLSNLIGVPFREIFKYNNDYEKKLKQKIEQIKDTLSKASSLSFQLLSDLFDSYTRNDKNTYIVSVDGMYNILNRNTLTFMLDEWYNRISGNFDVSNVITIENFDGKCNYLRNDYKILSDEWFNKAEAFCDTYGIVTRTNGYYNVIGIDGKLYVDGDAIFIGVACVGGNGKTVLKIQNSESRFNFFDATNLKYIGDRWFDGIGRYIGMHEYCPVLYNGKYNFINIKGEYLFNDGFDKIARCSQFYRDGWYAANYSGLGLGKYDKIYHITPYGNIEERDDKYSRYVFSKVEYGALN